MADTSGPNVARNVADAPDAGISHFTDDTLGAESSTVSRTQLISSIRDLSFVSGVQGIRDFLERPTLLASGSLAATDSTSLFSADPWALQLAGIKGLKLAGIGLMRADIVVRLQINAVRFQAGRYILCWLPIGGTASGASAAYIRQHCANLTTITQLPHVEIDLAKETHVTLRIPFTSDQTFLPITSTTFSYGYLFLYPYWPLIPGSSDTTCGYTCWGSFENIELSAPALPQSSFSLSKSATGKEQAEANIGPISGLSTKVAKTATILGRIPIFTAAMSSVSWLSGIVGDAAKVWGLSKPTVLSPPVRFVRELFPYMANADQQTTGQPLGLSATNEVPISIGVAPSALDEMSLISSRSNMPMQRLSPGPRPMHTQLS